MSDTDDRESEVVGQLGVCIPRCGMEEMKSENVSEKPERIVKMYSKPLITSIICIYLL